METFAADPVLAPTFPRASVAPLPLPTPERPLPTTRRPEPRARPVPTARERLIVEHHGMVRGIAIRMARRLPSHVDVDELVNVGVLGLIDAIDRYDANRGVPFRAYAEIRIRGAIVDALRHADWTPRAVRRSGARIDQARETLRRQLGREPDREETAEALGLAPAEYDRLRSSSEIRRVVSLDLPTGEDGEGRLADQVAADEASVLDQWMTAERHAGLAQAVEQLPEREQLVLKAYYQQGRSLKDIGAGLGVTESRVCQIHGQAIKRLQRVLREASDE